MGSHQYFDTMQGWYTIHGYGTLVLTNAGDRKVFDFEYNEGGGPKMVDGHTVGHWVTKVATVPTYNETLYEGVFRYLNVQELVDRDAWDRAWNEYRKANAARQRKAAERANDHNRIYARDISEGRMPRATVATYLGDYPEPVKPRKGEPFHERSAVVVRTTLPSGLILAVVQGHTGRCRVVSYEMRRTWVQKDDAWNPVRVSERKLAGYVGWRVADPQETLDLEFDGVDAVDDAKEAMYAWRSELMAGDEVAGSAYETPFPFDTMARIGEHQQQAEYGRMVVTSEPLE